MDIDKFRDILFEYITQEPDSLDQYALRFDNGDIQVEDPETGAVYIIRLLEEEDAR